MGIDEQEVDGLPSRDDEAEEEGFRFFFGAPPEESCSCVGVPLAPCSVDESVACHAMSAVLCGESLACLPGVPTYPDALAFLYGEMAFVEALLTCLLAAPAFVAVFGLPLLNFATIPLFFRATNRRAKDVAAQAQAVVLRAATGPRVRPEPCGGDSSDQMIAKDSDTTAASRGSSSSSSMNNRDAAQPTPYRSPMTRREELETFLVEEGCIVPSSPAEGTSQRSAPPAGAIPHAGGGSTEQQRRERQQQPSSSATGQEQLWSCDDMQQGSHAVMLPGSTNPLYSATPGGRRSDPAGGADDDDDGRRSSPPHNRRSDPEHDE